MKKLLTMLFLMAFAWTSYAQLANESFDGVTFPPTGWTTTPAGSGLSFARVTAGTSPTCTPHTGVGMVKCNSYNYSSGSAFLYTPVLDFTPGVGPAFKVKFWMYRDAGYAGYIEQIKVYANTTASSVGATLLGSVYRNYLMAPVVAAEGWYEYTMYIPGTYNTATNYIVIEGVTDYGNNMYIDDVTVVPQTAPNPAALATPVNGAIDVNTAVTLTWTASVGGDPATGYKLYVGTDAAATNLINGVNVGNVLNYSPAGLLTSTNYKWKVVATNAAGDAAGVAPIWNFTTFAGFGSLDGFVTNCYGVPVNLANVSIAGAPGTFVATTGVDGKYQFVGVPASTYTLTVAKAGYNTVTYPGIVIVPATLTHKDVTLTQPGMTVLPNPNDVTVSPNEMYNGAFTITNAGCGPLTWTASIAYGSSNHSWFTMPTLTGTVALSSNVSVAALFNATGLSVGTILSATVTFTSSPNVGTLVVPVHMVVAGQSLVGVTNLTGTLVDPFAGNVDLAWECTPGTGFMYYTVKRDGVQIALVPSATTYSDVLPAFGVYTYEVAAVYTDGATAPASVVVEWPNPTMTWTPAALAATVWSGASKLVPLTIGNTGLGTLAFSFPDYAGGGSGGGLLSYCAATTTYCDEFIGNVTIGSINNTTGCTGYGNYTSMMTDLTIGSTTAITVANGGSAYTSDYVYTWIDYNHNGTFEASEYKQILGNGAAFAGTITVPGTALSGPTTMRVRMSYGLAGAPCGNQAYGETEDYAVNLKVLSFITAVTPFSGTVAAGASQNINTTFSATGTYAPAGVYVSQLVLHSNDVAHASVNIPATMTVTVPGTIAGVVTDGFTNAVLPGVMVTATSGVATFTAMTGDNGDYTMFADAGTYTVTFSRMGYQTVTATGAVVLTNAVTTVNAQMFEEPYAPSCASASVNATDTQSTVTWCVPAGPYELLYDDGTAENYAAWAVAGNMNAVKFTPRGYPAHVVGAKLYVGDGSFPDGGVINGAAFDVAVYDVASNGMPGTMLSTVAATVTNLGWVNVSGLDATIASGDFFIVMVQGSNEPNCAPIGVDVTIPKAYKSYSINVATGGSWALSPYQDFMMHAIVSSPISGDDDAIAGKSVVPGKVAGMISQSAPIGGAGVEMAATVTAPEGYDNTDAVNHYSLSRIFLGAVTPVAPAAGVFTLLNNNITATTYTEGGTVWANLAQGWYAYGVKAVYPNAQESAFVYTNNVPHKLFADVTVNVKLVCGFVPAEGAFVTLSGLDYPNDILTATVPASGTVLFDNVIKGNYQVSISYSGYTTWVANFVINADKVIDAVLEDIRYMPSNLIVDDRTLVATWDAPLLVTLDQNFEAASFPPAGWQRTSNGVGWIGTTNGGSTFFGIPAHSKYACVNDDLNDDDESMSYLITPEMDLTTASSFVLSFQSYYTGAYGGSAYVEMSTDAGATWTPIETLAAAGSWSQVDVDLSAYSGAAGLASVWFAFHYDDNGLWADGWAVDDVTVASGKSPEMGYGVFLDGAEVGQTHETTFAFTPCGVNYGQTYVAGVAGLYCSGYSDLDTYTFTAHFLFPPRNLEAVANNSQTTGAVILTWEPPLSCNGKSSGSNSSDYSWMQSSGTLSTSGTTINAGPSAGFTATTDAATAEEEIKYCGDNNDAIGTGVAGDFIAAVRFTTDELYNFYNLKQITKAKIQLNSTGTWSSVTLKVWEGGAYGDPGTEVYSEDVTAQVVADEYTTVTLATPVPLVDGKEYWIGYAVTATGGYMMACDAGPIVPGKGAWMYYTGAWYELTDLGALPYNWNIVGIIDDASGPPNGSLLSYNLYRNDVLVASIPKTETTYWDLNLLPDTYCYDITAVYDLTPYGLAGQTDESLKEGTPCADVMYGYDLPFVEDWTTGQFDVNKWTTTGVNWIMDGQAGNLLPSAKFKWDPLLSNYVNESLESFYLNGAAINTTTPYKIWLDFDLKLDDRTASTMEKLTVEVYNGSSWSAVQEFANNGDFDWTLQHIDISAKAKHNVFKVRFRANGVLSGDIFYWAVDNVNVFVGYEFLPATNLIATRAATTPTNNDIKVTWEAPAGGIAPGSWIHYDDGVNSDGIGFNGPGDFSVAMLYPSSALGDYDGMAVKKVKFFPREAACEYSIRVWVGADLVVDQAVAAPVIGEWNEVELTTPAMIDAGQDLYIGYRNNTTAGFPAGCDAGPADAGLGDLISEDNGATWLSMANEYGLDYNWNIQAFVEGVGDGMVALQPLHPALPAANTGTLAVDPSNTETEANLAQRTVTYSDTDNSDAMTGYDLYRRAYAVFPAGQNTAAAGDWTKIASTTETLYMDNDLSNLVTNCYEYHVKAIYTEGESVMSNIDWECIFVGLNPNESNEVRVYPNPATTYVRIDLTKAVTEISVYNSLGSVVTTKNVKGETTITLNTNNYAAGAYNVKFTTENGETFSRKFVVTK